MRNRLLILATVAGLPILAAPRAAADVIFETIDAGDMPHSAFFGTGNGVLTAINGALADGVDVDMYAIYVTDPAGFSATTSGGGAGRVYDTQLFLFDAGGYGVSANDDITNGAGGYNPRSRLAAGSAYAPAATGLYYIAISGWDRDPHSAAGPIFTDDVTYVGTVGPTNVGGALPVSGWDSNGNLNGGIGNYTIQLTGASFATPIPEAPTLALAAMGVLSVIRPPRRR